MDLVIDTSAIIAVVANEPEKAALVEHTMGATLFAPASVPWEVGNAFSAMLKRKRVTLDQVRAAMTAYQEIPIQFIEVDINRALGHSDKLGVYAYDAYIIEAAKHHQCPLLTLDRGLRHAANEAGVDVVEASK